MEIFIWSFLIVFMLHNLEEIITIEKWFMFTYPRVNNRIPSIAQAVITKNKVTTVKFAMTVFVFSIIASSLIFLTITTEYYFLFWGLNLFFALNIFLHPIQSLFLRCYTPGLWTTVCLILPYNIWIFYHFSISGVFTITMFMYAAIVMILLVPLFALSHIIANKWESSKESSKENSPISNINQNNPS
ncbi:HXXEE domain-containing protein [Evansella tamaricis]|uniref:HXXEE domain-containing protein n=1 Tax=Evansella tamaricis TaxID=2069301 RepID=A0ABS6JJ58_9BACI|nr:HXXEE domain-containing protein [Evansella tamaricis]MBU9713695.1 HXXEE domain-containing protein [Evansella tamaricis]